MSTVLSVAFILAVIGGLFFVMDDQRISSSVNDYMRTEYRVSNRNMTVSGLRNL